MQPPELAFRHAAFLPRLRGGVDLRYHGFWSLHLQLAGRVQVTLGTRSWTLDGPWLWCHRPPLRCTVRVLRPRRHYRLSASGALLARWDGEGLLPREPVEVGDAAAAAACFDRVVRHAARPDAWDQRLAANALEALLLQHGHPHAKPGRSAWLAELAARLARGEPPPSTAALADWLGCSPAAVARRFRQETGTGLRRWLLERRMAAATARLAAGASVAATAAALGFSDPGYFTRQFRRVTGMAPADLRRPR